MPKESKRPELQVCVIHGGAKTYWLNPSDKRMGSCERYLHPDCVIWCTGSRTTKMDTAVMLALQDVHMPVRALVYYKKRGK